MPTKDQPEQLISRRTVSQRLDLDSQVLDRLEELQVIVPVCRPGRQRAYAPEDVDRIRVYALLVQELDVNPAGAEIILRMRNRLLLARQRMMKLLLHAREQGILSELESLLESLEEEDF